MARCATEGVKTHGGATSTTPLISPAPSGYIALAVVIGTAPLDRRTRQPINAATTNPVRPAATTHSPTDTSHQGILMIYATVPAADMQLDSPREIQNWWPLVNWLLAIPHLDI